MKTLVVAGTFDANQGKSSGLIAKLFKHYPEEVKLVNGGNYEVLKELLESVVDFDVVFWFANVDNSLPKIRDVKEVNPKCILVTSKRNDNQKYCFHELANRSLRVKANLTFEFSKVEDLFQIRVFDPIGNVWCNYTTNYEEVIHKTYHRIKELITFTRQNTIMTGESIDFQVEEEFLDIIHEKALIFHNIIQPPEVVDRFLGNVSFRCIHGFPSFRGENCIIVSRRNVNKKGIQNKDFVPLKFESNQIFVYSQNKPSVDSPIQVRLYELFPAIKYMMHSHVYIKDKPFTKEIIPCGAIEEVQSIINTIKEHKINTNKSFAINLLGHGSTVFATDLNYFHEVEYIKRNIPEII